MANLSYLAGESADTNNVPRFHRALPQLIMLAEPTIQLPVVRALVDFCRAICHWILARVNHRALIFIKQSPRRIF